jgi:hypothetical protein
MYGELSLAAFCYAMRWCFTLEPIGECPERIIFQESIGRLWKVELKRDVNGFEGRLKPLVYGVC